MVELQDSYAMLNTRSPVSCLNNENESTMCIVIMVYL